MREKLPLPPLSVLGLKLIPTLANPIRLDYLCYSLLLFIYEICVIILLVNYVVYFYFDPLIMTGGKSNKILTTISKSEINKNLKKDC